MSNVLQELFAHAHATSFAADTDEVVPDLDDMDLAKFDAMVPDPVNPTNLSGSKSMDADSEVTNMRTPSFGDPQNAANTQHSLLSSESQIKNMNKLFGRAPKADLTKLDNKGMQSLRIDAFDKEDAQAATTWAANLAVLKKQCFADDHLPSCKTLTTESMYMAAKYYQMWDETLSMWNAFNTQDSTGSMGSIGEIENIKGVPSGMQNLGMKAGAMTGQVNQALEGTGYSQAQGRNNGGIADMNAQRMKLNSMGVPVVASLLTSVAGLFLGEEQEEEELEDVTGAAFSDAKAFL